MGRHRLGSPPTHGCGHSRPTGRLDAELAGGESAPAVGAAPLPSGCAVDSTSPTLVHCSYASVGESSFAMPAGIASVTVDAIGAAGAYNSFQPIGGRGGEVTGVVATIGVSTLYVEVGRAGATGTTQAGGASDVRTTSVQAVPDSALTAANDSRRLVAAGGGAAGIEEFSCFASGSQVDTTEGQGGSAGQPGGDGGTDSQCPGQTATGGGAGGQTMGGTAWCRKLAAGAQRPSLCSSFRRSRRRQWLRRSGRRQRRRGYFGGGGGASTPMGTQTSGSALPAAAADRHWSRLAVRTGARRRLVRRETITYQVSAQTSTSVSSSVNPSAVGQQLTYTATVGPVPDARTVTFSDGTSPISGCSDKPVDTTTGKATCTVTYAGNRVPLDHRRLLRQRQLLRQHLDPANTDGRQGLDDDVNVVVGEPLGGWAAAHLHRDGGPGPGWADADVLRRNLSDQRLQRQAGGHHHRQNDLHGHLRRHRVPLHHRRLLRQRQLLRQHLDPANTDGRTKPP